MGKELFSYRPCSISSIKLDKLKIRQIRRVFIAALIVYFSIVFGCSLYFPAAHIILEMPSPTLVNSLSLAKEAFQVRYCVTLDPAQSSAYQLETKEGFSIELING